MGNYSIQKTARQVDELYSQRHRIENVRASVAILESEASRGNDYEIQWRLGRALFFLGQEVGHKESSHSYHSQGIVRCEQAVKADPAKVEGHFWLGVNLALLAGCEARLVAIRHALRARRELQQAIEIDATYHAAGPLRVLARLQQKMPRWLGRGFASARTNYEKAISLAPANTVTRVYFAELLIELGEQDLARAQLEFVLGAADDSDWSFEIERDRRIAKEMLSRFAIV
ncbi:MAG: TRAP transporter TatT component family protein [Pyrinomonadaceae bacterium]